MSPQNLSKLCLLAWHNVTTIYIYILPPDPEDYRGGTPLPLSFSSTTSGSQCGTIPIVNDDICEGDETFTCQLSTTDSQIALSPSAGTVTIDDDDGNLSLLLYIK